jgi:DNA-binding NarL/FixJ family response regulator
MTKRLSKAQAEIQKNRAAIFTPRVLTVAEDAGPCSALPDPLSVYPRARLLSKAEIRTLRAIAQAGDYRKAALALDRAVKTIENHLVNIHWKLSEPSTVRCVLIAERCGLLFGVE